MRATQPRRLLTGLVSAALLFTISVAADPRTTSAMEEGAPSPFTDIDGSSFFDEIVWLADAGISTGCTTTTFCPKATVTREQMAAFLSRALALPETDEDPFTDDETSTLEASINRIYAAGITTGCTATTFCPKASVTREQMAAFLSRALALPVAVGDHFTDDEASALEDSINRLFESGITTGCTATTFCPNLPVTREQMAAFLYRALYLEALDQTLDVATAAAAFRFAGERFMPTPVNCGGSPATNCPNGVPSESPALIRLFGSALEVIDVLGDERYDFSVTATAETVTGIPTTLPLVGDCLVVIDTAAGTSPTIEIDGTMRFDSWRDGGPMNQVVFSNTTITGLSGDDVSLGGSFGCQFASFSIGFLIDTLTDAIAGWLQNPICGVYGPELFIDCPPPPVP